MKTNTLIVLLFVLSAVLSCKPSKKELSEKEKLINEIITTENKLYASEEINLDLAYKMIEQYIEFVNKYSSDSLAPDYLFKSAEISMNINEPEDAIVFLTRIESNYQNYFNYPVCLFLKAFVFENYIGDIKLAEKYYNMFLHQYPDHPMAEDAEAALLYLGMNDEQLLELFSVMNKYN